MKDFTQKYSGKYVVVFLLPLILSEVVQEFYALINTAVVSRWLTYEAVAVIGTCHAFSRMQDHVFISLAAGFGVYIAKCIGSKDDERFQMGLSGAVYILGILGTIAVILAIFARPMLIFMNTSDELLTDATKYLVFLLLGCFFIALKTLLTSVIQGFGDTRFISVVSMIGVITHTGFVVLLIAGFKMGVEASSLAILLNNILYSFVLCVYLKKNHGTMIRILPIWKMSGSVMKKLGKNGISKSAMTMLVGIGTFFMQNAINTLPTETIAAYGYVNGTINSFFMQPLVSCATAAFAISAQNAGCGNLNLLRKYTKVLTMIDLVIAGVSMIICYTMGAGMIRLLGGESVTPEIISSGMIWFYICTPAYAGLALFFIYRNVLQVLGDYSKPGILGSIEMLITTVIALFFVPRFGFVAVCISIATCWMSTGLLSVWLYLRKIKKIELENEWNGDI